MAKVMGIGGVFFKAADPEQLGAWYRDCLGVPLDPSWGASFGPDQLPAKAFTIWAPFKQDTSYFDPSAKPFMINLVVDDLEGALSQVAEAGGQVVGEVEEHEYGRFGWFMDPEGNKVELWEPPG